MFNLSVDVAFSHELLLITLPPAAILTASYSPALNWNGKPDHGNWGLCHNHGAEALDGPPPAAGLWFRPV